jgi:hypothetical protein
LAYPKGVRHMKSLMQNRIKSESKVKLLSPIFPAAFFVALALVAWNMPASAAAEENGWVGGAFGLSVPTADNSTSRPIWGINAGAKVGSEYGLGAYYMSSSKDEGNALGTFSYDLFGIEAAYYFEGEAKGVYFGARLGSSKLKFGPTGSSISTSPVHYGVVAGYNHFIGSNFSLGGDISLLAIPGSSGTTTTGATVNVNSFTMLNFMADAKFWF